MRGIYGFDGEYRFFSNFATVPGGVIYDGLNYLSTEAAYQAAKTLDKEIRAQFYFLNGADAKKLGRTLELRPDWDEVKYGVMLDLTRQKYRVERFQALLLDTGEAYIQEDNYWHDTYWGVCTCSRCNGEGLNMLGKIIMKVRDELRGIN